MEESRTMYPRVKVREDKEEDDEFLVQEETCSLPLFRISESVSVQRYSLPGISSVSDSGDEACSILPASFPNVGNNKQVYTTLHACHTGKESQNYSSASVARIPVETTTSISTSKGVKNSKKFDEETRIRASSLPRPRAVISSPENDWMIGSRNRLARERSPNLKKNNLGQKSPTEVKCIRAAGPMSTRKGSDESRDRKGCLDEKKGQELKIPKQKTFLSKGKPSSLAV